MNKTFATSATFALLTLSAAAETQAAPPASKTDRAPEMVDVKTQQAWDLHLADEAAAARNSHDRTTPPHRTVDSTPPRPDRAAPLAQETPRLARSLVRLTIYEDAALEALEQLALPDRSTPLSVDAVTAGLTVPGSGETAPVVPFDSHPTGSSRPSQRLRPTGITIADYHPTHPTYAIPESGFDALAIMIDE